MQRSLPVMLALLALVASGCETTANLRATGSASASTAEAGITLPAVITLVATRSAPTALRASATASPTVVATETPTLTALPTATAEAAVRLEITVYTLGSARLRECPSTACATVDTLDGGTALETVAAVDGEAVNAGNVTWYEVQHGGRTAYVYSGVVGEAAPAAQGAAPVVGMTPAASGGSVGARPGNCATAVAMGLTAQQAAAWSHLDRDNDGVACYGD